MPSTSSFQDRAMSEQHEPVNRTYAIAFIRHLATKYDGDYETRKAKFDRYLHDPRYRRTADKALAALTARPASGRALGRVLG